MIVEIGANDYSWSSSGIRSQGIHAWKIGTTTVNLGYFQVATDNDAGAAAGHYTFTASGWINADDFYSATGVGAPVSPSMEFRTWANMSTTNPLNVVQFNPSFTSVAPGFDVHPTTKNDPLGTHTYPVFSTIYAPESPAETIAYPYSNEIVAWNQATPGPVLRFGHTFSSSLSANFGAQYTIGAVSPTGKFYIFTTDGEGTLGNASGGTTCSLSGGTCRSDVFILNLTPPPAI
jgi:hypothetical protein